MNAEDLYILQLRDCFTAGYTFPQFCRDNNIKKPLFIAYDESRADFMREIFFQFKFDKKINPTFSVLNGTMRSIHSTMEGFVPDLKIESTGNLNLNNYDYIIVLNNSDFDGKFSKRIYLNQLRKYFITRAYLEIPLLHFLQRHPRVKLIVTNLPKQQKIADEEFSKQLLNLDEFRKKLAQDTEGNFKTLFDELGYTHEEARLLVSELQGHYGKDGSTYLNDNSNPLIGIKNGMRMTADQPENYVKKIYIAGNCDHYGFNAPFDKTIPSYLQKMLNENNLPYRVENVAQPVWERSQDIFYNLNKLAPEPGDIIFINALDNFQPVNLPFLDVSHAFDDFDYRKLWVYQFHTNELGYKILAEKYFQFLTENNFFRDAEFKYPYPPPMPHRYGIPREDFSSATKILYSEELEEHKKSLRKKRLKIGCIVMNANPFTLGHEYLVQYAASRVHKLFVMVVSEDKSDFTFAERFELVRRGTEQFPNVEVLPSGQFVISQLTFSGYFNKENLQDVYVDSTDNAEMFASEIAPSLGVTIKFDGEEPRDNVTRQYHDNLRTLLPKYGIEYCEIPRREINGEVISAKTVRTALKVGDFDKVKKLVPATTFDYLREKYFKETEK